jgi:membrane fusion protein, multidrug efflux system
VPPGPFAYVIKEDHTVEARPVKVAQIEDGEALIDDGLQPGETVVVDGQSRLQAGSRVAPRAAQRPGGGENADGSPAAPARHESGRRGRAEASSDAPAGGGARNRP